jgi:Nif-specific regulatory protein
MLWKSRSIPGRNPTGITLSPNDQRSGDLDTGAAHPGEPKSEVKPPVTSSCGSDSPDLPGNDASGAPEDCATDTGGVGVSRERLIEAMEYSGWVQAKAARILSLTPRQIGYALKKHNVEIKRF